MPRKQDVHLLLTDEDMGETYWCGLPMHLPKTTELGETTCEGCLKAAAEFGRQALVRGFELDYFHVKVKQ